jgi:hypothetical protein
MFDGLAKGSINMLALKDGPGERRVVGNPAPVPPDWFPDLVGDLGYAASRLTMLAAEVDITPPPLPALPGDTRDRVVWHLRQARFDLATVRGLAERIAASGEAAPAGVEQIVHRLAGQFLAGSLLRAEAKRDPAQALRRLSRYLEGLEWQLDDQLAATERPAEPPRPVPREPAGDDADDPGLDTLMERAGGAWSLAEAAEHCGVTRQAMHARLKAGTAFGLMQGREYRLPRAQFVEADGRATPLPGLVPVIGLFRAWSTAGAPLLEFLVSPSPHLDVTPLEALRAGRAEAVLAAARTRLDLEDENPPPS